MKNINTLNVGEIPFDDHDYFYLIQCKTLYANHSIFHSLSCLTTYYLSKGRQFKVQDQKNQYNHKILMFKVTKGCRYQPNE